MDKVRIFLTSKAYASLSTQARNELEDGIRDANGNCSVLVTVETRDRLNSYRQGTESYSDILLRVLNALETKH